MIPGGAAYVPVQRGPLHRRVLCRFFGHKWEWNMSLIGPGMLARWPVCGNCGAPNPDWMPGDRLPTGS